MGAEQELAAANARIAQYETQESERTKAAAIAGELGKFDLVDGAAAQLGQLIGEKVITTKTNDGHDLMFGPNYRSLGDHVSDLMKQPAYAHFLRSGAPAASGPAPAQAAPMPGAPMPGNPAAPPEPKNFGEAIVMHVQESIRQSPSGGDPRLNPSRPMALGRRGLPLK
jgi:hypothetical protein